MRNPSAATPGGAVSNRELAGLLGVSEASVRKWLKDERWQFGPAPWDAATIALIRAWRSRTLADAPAGALPTPGGSQSLEDLGPEKRARVALTVERVKSAQVDRSIKEGKFHSADDCRQRRVRQIADLKASLLGLADSLPFDPESKEIVRGRLLELVQRFAAGK